MGVDAGHGSRWQHRNLPTKTPLPISRRARLYHRQLAAMRASPPRVKASANTSTAGSQVSRQSGRGRGRNSVEWWHGRRRPGWVFVRTARGVFTTPDVTSGILESVTRRTILDIAESLDIRVAERALGRTELYLADEAFYCGTGQEIMPIVAFDGRPVGEGVPGLVTCRLQAAFDDIVRAGTTLTEIG